MDIGEKFDKSTFWMSNCNSTGGADLVFIFSCSALALLINFCMKSISCCWSDNRVFVPLSLFPLVLGVAESIFSFSSEICDGVSVTKLSAVL